MKTAAIKHDKLLLSRLQLFRNVDLEDKALLELLELCEYRLLATDEVILSTEVENYYLYVLLKGRLAIQLTEHGDIPLATVEPGECVGEMSIIDSRVPSAQVSAMEETTVLAIEQDILWRMVSQSHEIARNLLYIMSERVRYSNLVIADSLEMQHKYQQYACTDSLTGLHNRGWLDDAFERELQRSERDKLPLSLIMIDVDDFKDCNDNYGHLAGDQVLKKVAEAIRGPLRPNDLIARFGGEEFAVLLPETSVNNAKIIAERLRKHVCCADTGMLDGKQLPDATISLGIAGRQPGYSLDMMIAAADVALYHAKRNGKNRVEVAANVPVDV
ncbi:diguanylate cyclase/phosphodiesterase (GGDEF & EAL domains) with PAS/PAC sensor(s) [hydrothermal vent metagenome]|uniref:Diguanylate cyclase/phosphodiesterase (GGDEF & EAL domains) with PAS/PAC sensor(S) n=1 Tax=hydrothermal vent metagenome TaxID=652676 RepID=A0A3B0X1H4_9ZZZZ